MSSQPHPQHPPLPSPVFFHPHNTDFALYQPDIATSSTPSSSNALHIPAGGNYDTPFAPGPLISRTSTSRASYPNRPNLTTNLHSFPPPRSAALPPVDQSRQGEAALGAVPAHHPTDRPPHMFQGSMPHATLASPAHPRPLKRARTHERTHSASTTASNGPATPYANNNITTFPQIANAEHSPARYYFDQTNNFGTSLFTPQQTPADSSFANGGYIPTSLAPPANAQFGMKGITPDFTLPDDFPPDLYNSSRLSMSSGHESPATPQSGTGDYYDNKINQAAQNDYRQPNSNPQQFYAGESHTYGEDVYNTSFPSRPMPVQSRPDFLSPHPNLVSDHLQRANLARSISPASAMSGEQSPFLPNSPYVQAGNVRTAAGIRQQQKADAAEAEKNRAHLRRESTKTISPKDAMLEYNDTEQQPPLFQDQIPTGYRQHTNGDFPQWGAAAFTGQGAATFGNLSAQQQMMTYRAPSNTWEANDYVNLPQQIQEQAQISSIPFQNQGYPAPRLPYSETNPEFPAHLNSMESSVSEGRPPLSSQESFTGVQRPADTRANTGTYPCSYHGCTERFDSHVTLQRHKRDVHRAQQQQPQLAVQSHRQPRSQPSQSQSDFTPTPTSADEASATPASRSSASLSPGPSGSGMTSAALQARNSQAGPHKCARINPSTGKPCNIEFSRPYDLTRHEDTIHNNRKQKVRCHLCREEKTFSRNDALTRHMRVVHPEVSENFGRRGKKGE